ncbi:PPE family protein [Mycobacterium haemophilum]
MMDFHALAPEINASNIRGPGPESILLAKRTWETMAAELTSAAIDWSRNVSEASAAFQSPALEFFLKAASIYAEWLNKHVAAAQETATDLNIAVHAYETAAREMVPQATITANRAAALTLKTTNILGQFATKIAELDHQYHEYWDTNAKVMDNYLCAILYATGGPYKNQIVPAPMTFVRTLRQGVAAGAGSADISYR